MRKERKSEATATIGKSISTLGADVADIVAEQKEDIFRTLPSEMTKAGAVIAFCVLKRACSSLERRIAMMRKLVEEQFAAMPSLKAGEKEHVIKSGIFEVALVNTNHDKKALDVAGLVTMLKKKGIPTSEVTVRPPPPQAYIDMELVTGLCKRGLITENELDSVYVLAEPKTELRVRVPSSVEDAVEKKLLHGIVSRAR